MDPPPFNIELEVGTIGYSPKIFFVEVFGM